MVSLLGLGYRRDVQPCVPGPSSPGPFTIIVVVLYREDPALGSTGTVKDEFPVQGLDGERVQHTNVDLFCRGRRCRMWLRGIGLDAVGLPFDEPPGRGTGWGVLRVVCQLAKCSACVLPVLGRTNCLVPTTELVLANPQWLAPFPHTLCGAHVPWHSAPTHLPGAFPGLF